MEKDIKTILSLLADGHITTKAGIELLAEACGIDANKLSSSLFSSPPALKFTKWTPEDEQYVLEAWNRGDSIRSISAHLNRTKGAVRGRISIMQKNGHAVNARRTATAKA